MGNRRKSACLLKLFQPRLYCETVKEALVKGTVQKDEIGNIKFFSHLKFKMYADVRLKKTTKSDYELPTSNLFAFNRYVT